MFSGLWAKLTGAMSLVIGVLYMMLKMKNKEVRRLEDEVAGHEKKDEIEEEVKTEGAKVEAAAEKKREEVKNEEADWRNRI